MRRIPCLDRVLPHRKDRPISFDLPAIKTADDLPTATGAIAAAVAAGELSPSEAAKISKTLDVHVLAIEATDLHKRFAALEVQGSPTASAASTRACSASPAPR